MTALPRTRREDGFTLIELMIVVTIIGILAAVAIPRYVSYVRTSQTAEVNQVGGQIVSALQSYADAQSLTPSAAVTLFNSTVLMPSGATVPSGSTSLTTILPQLNLPSNATFNYTVSAIAATGGPQSGDVAYCILAVGNANAGNVGGQVLYSSSPATATAKGWSGRIYNASYVQGIQTLTGATAGGYCTAAGAASATQS